MEDRDKGVCEPKGEEEERVVEVGLMGWFHQWDQNRRRKVCLEEEAFWKVSHLRAESVM